MKILVTNPAEDAILWKNWVILVREFVFFSESSELFTFSVAFSYCAVVFYSQNFGILIVTVLELSILYLTAIDLSSGLSHFSA